MTTAKDPEIDRLERRMAEIERQGLDPIGVRRSLELARRQRNRELGAIHQGAKQIGMAEDSYRALLQRLTGQTSAAGLTHRQRRDVLLELQRLGAKGGTTESRPRPSRERSPLMEKIMGLLDELGFPLAYADAILKRQCQVDRCEWGTPEQLRGVVAALWHQAKRRQAVVA